MKFDPTLLAQLGAATRQLMQDGPAAATLSIQRALAGQSAGAAPFPFETPPESAIPSRTSMRARLRPRTVPPPTIAPGAQFIEASFSNHAGARNYKLYIPASYSGKPMPLLLMLHGCTQGPDDFANGTRMNEAAEEFGFLVAYPGQARHANHNGCWNWFAEGHQQHGQGEPSILADMVGAIAKSHAVDPARVFVAGLSAGGAMAATLATLYPDLFAAAGVHSGLPFQAAHDLPSALQAMKAGRTGKGGKPITVPLIVFHGDRDKVVAPRNGSQLLADAVASGSAAVNAIEDTGQSSGGRKYTRTLHVRTGGTTVAEEWIIHGAGHAWAGGSRTGSHTDPAGPDASREMLRFFRTVTGLV